jgi:AcrR family transcriptional regulator
VRRGCEILRPWRDGPSDRRSYHHGNLKEALIEAARRFIAERGIGGFTLVDAARLVGVTPAALYRHFRGREALLEELAGRGFAELAERLARALTSRGTPLERFTRMGETYLTFAEEEPAYYAAIFETRGLPAGATEPDAGPSPSDAAARPSPFDLLVEALQATFADGFGGVAPRFIALEVWALAHGLATLSAAGHLPRGPGFPDKYELLRAGVLALVHGAARSSGPEPRG